MKPRLLFVLALLPAAAAADTLYKCTGASGEVLYTNQKTDAKHCVVLSRDQPISTFAPPPRAKANTAPTPGDFPRVGADQQKARDNDRRAILEQELGNETKQLEDARRQLAEQEVIVLPEERIVGGGIQGGKRETRVQAYRDNVQLHERNVEALKKEIGNLR